MNILVDTSVWSLALRKNGPAEHPAVKKLATLLKRNEDIVLIGVVLQEILQAFRHESTFKKVARYLAPVALLPLGRNTFGAAATLHRKCAAHGVSATTIDCLIAAAAVEHQCGLLTADNDFAHIARHIKLELV